MADDTVVYSYPGATPYDTIATDDVGGKKYQRFKLDGGGDAATVPITAGQKSMAQSVPVVLASDQPAAPLPTGAATQATLATLATQATLDLIRVATQLMALWDQSARAKVVLQKPATSTVAGIAYTTTVNSTLLAANANRLGATIYNTNSLLLYLTLGSSVSGNTVYIPAGGYYEVPFGYTGIVTGSWPSGGNTGGAWVTEFLP